MDLVTAIGLALVGPSLRRAALDRWRHQSPDAGLGALLAGLGPGGTDSVDIAALLARAEGHVQATSRSGLRTLWLGHPAYPPYLDAIPDPPPVCWVSGEEDVLSTPAVAIVGSRAVGADTAAAVSQMGAALAGVGLVVVSGLARGVDGAAHHGAVETGRTIAVLGSSIDRLYPAEHDALAARIIRGGGALLSEWPPGTPARRHHFPVRNRVISGLSRGVVVAEASETSGALITARHALEQGREVMAMPGPVWGRRNRGAHALIKDGAPLVEDAADVVALLRAAHALDDWSPSGTPGALAAAGVAPPARTWLPAGPPAEPPPDAQAAEVLGRLGRATADDLRTALGWPTARILAVLADLEFDGRALRVAGGWIRAREG